MLNVVQKGKKFIVNKRINHCVSVVDTVKAFKERNKLGRFREVDPEEQKRLDEEKAQKEEEEKKIAESIKVGDRLD